MPAYVNAGLDLIDVLLSSNEVSLSLPVVPLFIIMSLIAARMHALHNGLFLGHKSASVGCDHIESCTRLPLQSTAYEQHNVPAVFSIYRTDVPYQQGH